MEGWLNELRLPQYIQEFEESGYDDLDVIFACMTDEKLASIGVVKVGHRDKILLDIQRRKTSTPGVSSENKTQINEPPKIEREILWKRERLGYIPYPRGDRTRYYNEIMPDFYAAARSYLPTDNMFKDEFVAERKRQFDHIVERNFVVNEMELLADDKFVSSEVLSPIPNDIRALSYTMTRVNKLRDRVAVMTESLRTHDNTLYHFDGMRIRKQHYVFAHKFNRTEIDSAHKFMKQLEKYKDRLVATDRELKSIFKGLTFQGMRRQSRMRKQNRRKATKRKERRSDILKVTTLKSLVPQLKHFSDDDLAAGIKERHIQNIDMVSIEEVSSSTRTTLKGIIMLSKQGVFSEKLQRFLTNVLPESLQQSYINAIVHDDEIYMEPYILSGSDDEEDSIHSEIKYPRTSYSSIADRSYAGGSDSSDLKYCSMPDFNYSSLSDSKSTAYAGGSDSSELKYSSVSDFNYSSLSDSKSTAHAGGSDSSDLKYSSVSDFNYASPSDLKSTASTAGGSDSSDIDCSAKSDSKYSSMSESKYASILDTDSGVLEYSCVRLIEPGIL